MLRPLALLLLIASAAAQDLRLDVDLHRAGKRLDPETREPWSGVGPYVHDRRRSLRFRTEGLETTRPLALTEHLLGLLAERGPGTRLTVVAAQDLDAQDLPPLLERLLRRGWLRLAIAGQGACADGGRAWLEEHGPVFLRVAVEAPGRAIETSTGEDWHGVGRRHHAGRVLSYRFTGGEPLGDLRQGLVAFRQARPDAQVVVEAGPGVRFEELAGLTAELRTARYGDPTVLVERETQLRWTPPGGGHHFLDVEWDGSVRQYLRVLLPANQVEQSDDLTRLRAELHTIAAGMAVDQHGLPDDPLLLRVHPSASFRHVQRLMLLCGQRSVRIWRVELAIAGIDDEYVPIWMPRSIAFDASTINRLPVTVTVEVPGTRLDPDRTPWDGQGPWIHAADRRLAYQFAVDRLTDVREVHALLRKVRAVEDLILVVDCAQDVTCGDLYPLLRAAQSEGVSPVFMGD